MQSRLTSLLFLGITYLLSPLFLLVAVIRRSVQDSMAPRVLVFVTEKIGDTVCATPLFREIKKKYPKSHITALVARPADEVLLHNPHINRFEYWEPNHEIRSALSLWWRVAPGTQDYSIALFPSRFSYALPFWLGIPNRIATIITAPSTVQRLLSPIISMREIFVRGEHAPHHHLKLLKYLGIEHPNDKREVFRNDVSDKKIEALLTQKHIENRVHIGISIGCGKGFRKWPEESFLVVAQWIINHSDADIFFVGNREDTPGIQRIIKQLSVAERAYDFSGQSSIADLPSLLAKVQLFIGVGTGPLFIADALGAMTVDIATDYGFDQPPQGRSIILKDENLPPCSYVMYEPDPQSAVQGMGILPDMVIDAVQKLLS